MSDVWKYLVALAVLLGSTVALAEEPASASKEIESPALAPVFLRVQVL